jgi:oxygen-independent coproporphyrinogen-3 oxidase
VHVPFCVAKCTYCDFYSVAAEGRTSPARWTLSCSRPKRRAPSRPRTVFLGGGTPSFYSIDELARLLDGLDRWSHFRASAGRSPASATREPRSRKARALRELGVDRLSIGFQSLEPRFLALFGRVHDARQSFAAFQAAREAGFERVSVDLIYGIPGQDLDRWEADLARVLALRPTMSAPTSSRTRRGRRSPPSSRPEPSSASRKTRSWPSSSARASAWPRRATSSTRCPISL